MNAQINRRTVGHKCIFILSFIVQDVLHVSAFPMNFVFSYHFYAWASWGFFGIKNSKHVTGFGLRKRWLRNFDPLAICRGLPTFGKCYYYVSSAVKVESSWNVMAHGDAREGKWRGNWRMEWVASTLHTTSEHGVSNITTADAHTPAASSGLNWHPSRFKWTRPFCRKTKSGFYACAITFQLASTFSDPLA